MSIAIVPVTVPSSGDGPIASIAALVGAKTVTLTGRFEGSYSLLASHNDANFVPVLAFNSDGLESIKLTLPDAYKSVRVRTNANTVPSGAVSVQVAGVSKPGENAFATLVTFLAGAGGGSSPVVDTATLFPPTGLEEGINFACEGGLVGSLLVEGSNDGVNFNVVGLFQGGSQARPLVGLPSPLEFTPLSTPDQTRYVRLTLQGQVVGTPLVVTMGGNIPASGSSPGSTSVDLSGEQGKSAVSPALSSDEQILYEWETNLVALAANLTLVLNTIAAAAPFQDPMPSGTIRVYVGATNPGDTAGATLVLTVAGIVSPNDAGLTAASAAFANPGGMALVQLTGQIPNLNEGPAYELDVRGVTITIG